eukprot:418766-Prymnesium_polylepis.1
MRRRCRTELAARARRGALHGCGHGRPRQRQGGMYNPHVNVPPNLSLLMQGIFNSALLTRSNITVTVD